MTSDSPPLPPQKLCLSLSSHLSIPATALEGKEQVVQEGARTVSQNHRPAATPARAARFSPRGSAFFRELHFAASPASRVHHGQPKAEATAGEVEGEQICFRDSREYKTFEEAEKRSLYPYCFYAERVVLCVRLSNSGAGDR